MIKYCRENLLQIKNLTDNISDENYHKPIDILFSASIGQHIRHALEFYFCLFEGLESKVVNYDTRKRQNDIESYSSVASEVIDVILKRLNQIESNQKLEIKANYTSDDNDEVCMYSTLYRELGFCLEHCIHHQAFVKTGLRDINQLHLVNKNFGVAPSTLRNQKKCVQ
jgi:hypothetical protein